MVVRCRPGTAQALTSHDGRGARSASQAPSWTVRNRAFITAALSFAPPSGGRGAQVAQLVEHCTENAGVGGSIPPLGTTLMIRERHSHLNMAAAFCREQRRYFIQSTATMLNFAYFSPILSAA